MCKFLFCGCDKKSGPRQLLEESIQLGLWFQKDSIHDDRMKVRLKEQLRAHILNCKQEAERES